MRQAYLTGVSGDDVSSAYGEDVRPPDNLQDRPTVPFFISQDVAATQESYFPFFQFPTILL
jgi:hypothetical protein